MSDHCCAAPTPSADPAWRRILWIALLLNAALGAVEIGGGLAAGSVALLADAIDFFGDAANYGISLAVLSMAPVWRPRAALIKAASMAAFGVFVLGRAAWAATTGVPPEPVTMGAVAALALAVNVGVALLLYRYRTGDSNMRSVWICSRNDAIGNLAVVAAAAGVFGTGSHWPDLVVAAILASLGVSGGVQIVRHAKAELRGERAARVPAA